MKIPELHLEYLLKYFQGAHDSLEADGLYGPKTALEIDNFITFMDASRPSLAGPMTVAFNTALYDAGKKEQPLGSNEGPYLDRIRIATGMPRRGGGEWCAVFISYHLQRAGLPVASRGAMGVAKELAALPGGYWIKPEECLPGKTYVAVRSRGFRKHHVQFFRLTETIGGKYVRHVGGNEKHRVKTEIWSPPNEFFKGVKKVAGYDVP